MCLAVAEIYIAWLQVYVCGEPGHEPLPDSPRNVSVSEEKCDTIIQNCSYVASCLGNAEVLAKQACYLPVNEDSGMPIIGRVPGLEGAVVATGHSCWGILNGPATGLAVAELMVDGQAHSVDLAPFALSSAPVAA